MENLIEIIAFIAAGISFVTACISFKETKHTKNQVTEVKKEINHIKEIVDYRKINQNTLSENSKNIYSEGNIEIGSDIK